MLNIQPETRYKYYVNQNFLLNCIGVIAAIVKHGYTVITKHE